MALKTARADWIQAIAGAVVATAPPQSSSARPFVVPDNGGREVFVRSSVLLRSGMTDLAPG